MSRNQQPMRMRRRRSRRRACDGQVWKARIIRRQMQEAVDGLMPGFIPRILFGTGR